MAYVFTNVTQANFTQRGRLRDEILSGRFLDGDSLNILLNDIGNTTLEQVSPARSNLQVQFAAALEWISEQKLIGKFCTGVIKQWPDREVFLSELFDRILSDTATVQGGALRDHIHLFDRVDQETIFTTAICRIPENEPVPPVVVMISGVFEDEVNLMLDRIVKKSILDCYSTPPQKRVPYVLEMTQAVTALGLFQQLASKVLGRISLRERVEDLLPKVQARIAGQMFGMRLRSNAVTADTGKVFAEFFGYWSTLGSHPLPPFLFLLVVHDEAEAPAAPVVSPAAWYEMIRDACAPCPAPVMLVEHLVLGMCHADDIANWIDSLSADEADSDFTVLVGRARTVLDQSLLVRAQQPFRLRQVKVILDEKL
jgi:hypothetical protein